MRFILDFWFRQTFLQIPEDYNHSVLNTCVYIMYIYSHFEKNKPQLCSSQKAKHIRFYFKALSRVQISVSLFKSFVFFGNTELNLLYIFLILRQLHSQ